MKKGLFWLKVVVKGPTAASSDGLLLAEFQDSAELHMVKET
jgi:hypothetical protein